MASKKKTTKKTERTMYDSSSHARRARRLTDKIMAKKKAMRDK